jgi:hypothetical protein
LSAAPDLKRNLTKQKMDQLFFRLSNFSQKGINTNITSFVLTHSIAENNHFEHVSKLASLTHVNLAMSSHISDGVLPYLASLTNLRELVLNNILINGNGLENLKNFQHLKYLNVRSHGDVLDALPLVPNLEELFLTHSVSPSKLKNFGNLAALTNLKALSIPPKFNYDQLKVIGELTTLKSLKLQTGIFENLEPLQKLTNLETLSLTSCKFFKNNKSHFFPNMEHLTRLEIIMCASLKSEGMQRFSELPNLKCLQLSYVTLQPFSFVTSFSTLNMLSLVGFQLSDEDVNSLLSVDSLVNIQLFKCNSLHDRTLQNFIMNDVNKKVVCM